ncbi:MAG TPA: EF-Tu/IF-2/RF-3 family GTPase [Anaerolineales bacterium]|nr:EF-Tu/IF-2/RF-3 family GTPase [Anaerolineales bacterium]
MTTDPLFRMTVQDVFSIRDRGTVITGKIESGALSVGDEIAIQRQGTARKAVVTGLESFRKQIGQASAGDEVGVLLRDVTKDDVRRGDVLVGSSPEFTWKP